MTFITAFDCCIILKMNIILYPSFNYLINLKKKMFVRFFPILGCNLFSWFQNVICCSRTKRVKSATLNEFPLIHREWQVGRNVMKAYKLPLIYIMESFDDLSRFLIFLKFSSFYMQIPAGVKCWASERC